MTPQQYARVEAIAGLIDFLDLLDGDTEAEEETDRCGAHDDDPQAFVQGDKMAGDPEDGEPEEDGCNAKDDDLTPRLRAMGYPGDAPGESDDCELNGDEHEQSAYSAE